jgi:Collagen triple helix repeat (20 copies)
MRRVLRFGWWLTMFAAASVIIASGAVGVSGPPSTTGVIHACVSKSGGDDDDDGGKGSLRVIDPSKGDKCKKRELALSWNQQGLKGDKGDQGARGDTGEKGAQGEQGVQGIQGIQGIQGEQGLKGDTGEKGAQGDQGIQGLQGEQGLKGDTGEKGAPGDQGLQGLKGDTGDKGEQGLQGEKGEKGDKGEDAPEEYGVAVVRVKRGEGTASEWARYSVELGSPVGDTTGGTFRFTCRVGDGQCEVTIRAAVLSATSGPALLYPRLLIYRGGAQFTAEPALYCEFGDGPFQQIQRQPLNSLPPLPPPLFFTPLGTDDLSIDIGDSADCNGPVTTAGAVAKIVVPEGYYDVFATFGFSK